MTCLTPISATTGFDDFIVPFDTMQGLRHILGNDPRPHYAHQSNLAEDRTLLPITESILKRYRSLFATNAPVASVSETQAADILTRQTAWTTGATRVEGYTLNNEIYIQANGYTGQIPVTAPAGTKVGSATGAAFGEAYAGERSAWIPAPGTTPTKLIRP